MNPGDGGAQFSLSETGHLAYIPGSGTHELASIYWMDREGKFQPLRETAAAYFDVKFSPDGKRLALEVRDGKRWDIWVYDLERDALTRLTFTGDWNIAPIWTPDGHKITYASGEKGELNIYWKRADGASEAQRLTTDPIREFPLSWRPDGKVLAFARRHTETSRGAVAEGDQLDIYTLSAEGDEHSGWRFGEPKPFLTGPFREDEAAFSPDGRWLTYVSDESGDDQVYVRPFPGPGGKWQVSTGGGHFPKWSNNRKELFYGTPDNKIMVLTYTAPGDSFSPDKPQLWSPGQFSDRLGNPNFDLHPDGKRFTVLKAPSAESQPVVNKVSFIFNFFDELRHKVPSK